MRRLCLILLISTIICPHFVAAQADDEVYDPWEGMNRNIFWFNDQVDVHVFEPVAEQYRDVVPRRVRTGIKNFFGNLRYPVFLVSDLVQLNFSRAVHHTGRFLVNTTAGIAGVMDVAKDIGLDEQQQDFGLALAHHGVPPGPYLVLPLLGPSNFRDTLGVVVDTVLNPFYWVGYTSWSDGAQYAVASGATVLKIIDTRSRLLEAVSSGKESAIDYYLFVQGAYYQYRRGLLNSGLSDEDQEASGGELD